jgi:putative transposase
MTEKLTTTRKERGQAIANLERQIKRIDNCLYTVKSQSSKQGEYTVYEVNGEWHCECLDHRYRNLKCKHLYAVEISQNIRNKVEQNRVIPELNAETCIYYGSTDIIKGGKRHNKFGDNQLYRCRTCHKRFSFNIGFERMRVEPKVITNSMQLYFSGESLRNVQKFLKLQGITISHVAIGKWINKYTKLMEQYLAKIKPNVSDKWRADELYVKIKGNMKYLFAMMDDETRFWIAQEVAESKDRHDARNLLRMSKEVTGKKPMTFITDGLPSYHDAYLKEFWNQGLPKTQHIRQITLKGIVHNNKMERMNGEIRDREKVMRGLKKEETSVLKGYQIYHNYFRPHESLNGKTPSEACGITIEGKNKWLTLIQNASKKTI